MSQAAANPIVPHYASPPVRPSLIREARWFGADLVLAVLARSAAVVVLLMLASLVAVLAFAAKDSIKTFGLKFLVTSEWRPNELQVPKVDANGDPVIEDGETVMTTIPPAFGALPVIYGTAVSSLISLVIAVPLSFGAALFLIRIAPKVLAGPVSFLIEFLAAIPSIAYGIWGLFVLGPKLQEYVEPAFSRMYDRLPEAGWVELIWGVGVVVIGLLAAGVASRRAVGKSVLAAAVAVCIPLLLMLALLALDGAVGRMVHAKLPAVESGLHATLGGSPNLRWLFHEKIKVGNETIYRQLPLTGRDMLCGSMVLAVMILPIITAISRDVLRSVPRAQVEATVALGATWWQSSWQMLRYSRSGLFGAVMLGLARAAGETMAITMVIGNNNQIRASIFAPAQTMSSLLANEFAEASTDIHRAALTEVALVLLLMSLVFNVVARYLVVGKSVGAGAGQ